MENASKALIIAGGMLIALLVVSLLVIGWNNITSYNRQEEMAQTMEQITKFNKEFESYNKQVVYGYQLISLNNLILDTNYRYNPMLDNYREVKGYVKFLKDSIIYNQVSADRQKEMTQDYMELNKFIEEYYQVGGKDFEKIFKESFFQCDNVVYDGEVKQNNGKIEVSGKGSGRVVELYFTQIAKTN